MAPLKGTLTTKTCTFFFFNSTVSYMCTMCRNHIAPVPLRHPQQSLLPLSHSLFSTVTQESSQLGQLLSTLGRSSLTWNRCRNFICKELPNDTECQNVSKLPLVLQIDNQDSPVERELFPEPWIQGSLFGTSLVKLCLVPALQRPWNTFILSFRSLLSL